MSELFNELADAMTSRGLVADEVSNKNLILDEIKKAFIATETRAWWNGFRKRPEIHTFNDNTGFLSLAQIAPTKESWVYFIVDEDNENKFVFDVPFDDIPKIIQDCRYFEYYITPHDYSWLMAESDHGDVLLMY